jgi:hypothetical protein
MNSYPQPRHLTRDNLAYYLASQASAVIKIDGDPVVFLCIEPTTSRLSLRIPHFRGALPDLSGYQHLSAAVVHWNDASWFELRVGGSILLDAYPLVCLVADKVQLEHADFAHAVVASLASLRQLLAGHARLSDHEQVGLFGELLVLRHLLNELPGETGLSAWRGPQREEHDFDLGGDDVEVKTTMAEDRHHWITNARQLSPSVGRPLWLVSLQVTGAGSDGTSLSDLIAQIESALTDHGVAELRQKLNLLDWREETAWLYPRKLRLRTKPEIYDVDDHFPALTPARLVAAGIDPRPFTQLKYLLDLSVAPPASTPPSALAHIPHERRHD